MYSKRKDNYRPIIYDLIDFENSNFKNLLFELIISCLAYNPKKRPSSVELLKFVLQLENLIDRKSNFNYNSSNLSKNSSYSDILSSDFIRNLDNKDSYLESIKNRTKLRRKYDTSYESNIIIK